MQASVIRLSTGDPSLAGRYLADQLSEEERRAFEERMASDPAVMRELEATARFKAGLERLRETGELQLVLASPPRRAFAPYIGAIAASLIAALLVSLGVLRWNADEDVVRMAATMSALVDVAGNELPAGRVYTLLRTRAAVQDFVVELPASRQAIEFVVLPDTGGTQSRYRVELSDGNGARATVLDGLQARADGFLSFFVDSAGLAPGAYRIRIDIEQPTGPAVAAGDFRVDVRAGATRQ
jgi:anti-sigma-K factor RskA